MVIFASLPEYIGETVTVEHEGFTLEARLHHDEAGAPPWDNEDGHGPVSDWRRRNYAGHYSKAPGELLLCEDGRAARFYDFAAACEIARRDGWGVSPYRLDRECNAYGIHTVTAHWFHGCDLIAFKAIGDDLSAAIASVYAQHRESMTARQYAALAAMSDYDRLRAYCIGDWGYCGVVVTASRNGIALGSASLWGIETDAGDYLREAADELASEAIGEAREALASLCDCEAA